MTGERGAGVLPLAELGAKRTTGGPGISRPLTVLAAALAIALTPPLAAAHERNGSRQHCHTRACHARVLVKVKLRAIAPFREWLARTGQCESDRSIAGRSLKRGLRALSPGGTYRGRYQFDMASWAGAGGRGDPIDANWLEQAYRAVRWRTMVGRGAWPVCG